MTVTICIAIFDGKTDTGPEDFPREFQYFDNLVQLPRLRSTIWCDLWKKMNHLIANTVVPRPAPVKT